MISKQKRFQLFSWNSGWYSVVLGTSSLFLLASCGSNLSGTATPSPTIAASSSPTSTTTGNPSPSPTSTVNSNDPVNKQILGTWQGKDPDGKDFSLIFSPEGNMFPIVENGKKAFKFTYKLDAGTNPQNIDISSSRGETAQTILELTSDGQLRIQLDGVNPKKQRPTDFSGRATLLKRVSDVATLPAEVKVDDPGKSASTDISPDKSSDNSSTNGSTRVKQARARSYTGTLNRASQAYFVENERFTGDIDQLLKGVRSKPNSPNYDFSLALIDEKKAVQTIVVAKLEGLKSYTGLAYVNSLKSNGANIKSIICESDRPTQDKPAAPELANNEAKCPAGYTQLNLRRY
jgi:uncharacterized protein (TIGR03067 family)